MKKSFKSLTFFFGIDVSKLTLDVTVLIPSTCKKKYKRVGNGWRYETLENSELLHYQNTLNFDARCEVQITT